MGEPLGKYDYQVKYSKPKYEESETPIKLWGQDLEKSVPDDDKINHKVNITENHNPIPEDFEIESDDKNHEDEKFENVKVLISSD